MAKIKFRSLVAEISEKKTDDGLIDSGATHNFFHSRSSFITYTRMFDVPVEGATGSAKVVGKGTVWVPIGRGMKITAYHVPAFSQNILSGGSLSVDFEVVFSTSIRPENCDFIMMKGFNDIIGEYPMKNGLFLVPIATKKCLKVKPKVYVNRTREFKKIDEWHRKLGYPHPNRIAELASHCDDAPNLNSSSLRE